MLSAVTGSGYEGTPGSGSHTGFGTSAGDNGRITVLVKLITPSGQATGSIPFNRVLERLRRIESVLASDQPIQHRVIRPQFVSSANVASQTWAEFQAHRRVLGLICVSYAPHLSRTLSLENLSPDNIDRKTAITQNDTNDDYVPELEHAASQYDQLKNAYKQTLFDSRCALFGFGSTATAIDGFRDGEVLTYDSMENSGGFEADIKEFLKALYWVLEGKRLDLSFEKMDNPSCPLVPEEEKYRVGLENRNSKNYRRKCVGRLRKQVADFALMTGLPTEALKDYSAAIELLKTANDWLWLAGALEGWGCAALTAKYGYEAATSVIDGAARKRSGFQRVPTFSPGEMRQHSSFVGGGGSPIKTPLGPQSSLAPPSQHQRNKSDDGSNFQVEIQAQKQSIPYTEISDKFGQALENYGRFSFASLIEYECVLKAASVYLHERLYIDTELFLREKLGKYLDDNFNYFDHIFKSSICYTCAMIFDKIGFKRKSAFFLRLTVLFRLHIGAADANRQQHDYRQVYPLLLNALKGYGITPNIKDASSRGCAPVRVRALHELFISAHRAGYYDASVRHLCYMIQYLCGSVGEQLSSENAALLTQLCQDLVNQLNQRVVRQPLSATTGNTDQQAVIHDVSSHLQLPTGAILPPLPMNRLPTLLSLEVLALSPRLAPQFIEKSDDIFIYKSFGKKDTDCVRWVVGCVSGALVTLKNCLPVDLTVTNLVLLTECGGTSGGFDPIPVQLLLPARSAPITVKLLGTPTRAGKLALSGYSCEIFSSTVKNVCKFRDIPWLTGKKSKSKGAGLLSFPVEIETLPHLPLLDVCCTLDAEDMENVLKVEPKVNEISDRTQDYEKQWRQPIIYETSIYSGQSFEHVLTLTNLDSVLTVARIELELNQPRVFGGAPPLVRLMTPLDEIAAPLQPREQREIRFTITGVDPMAESDEGVDVARGGGGTASSSIGMMPGGKHSRQSSSASVSTTSTTVLPPERIPYTGRLSTARFLVRYECRGVEEESVVVYERRLDATLHVTILPAVVVADWHLLPGDSPASRYVVLDVSNYTEHEAELLYAVDRAISVQPREMCRVPLLCPCCDTISASALSSAQLNSKSTVMLMEEYRRLKTELETHVGQHLDVRWKIPELSVSGVVPVGPLLASLPLLKQLVLPPVTVGVRVNGRVWSQADGDQGTSDHLSFGVSQLITLEVELTNSLPGRSFRGALSLCCYQDLQTSQSGSSSYVDRSDHLILIGPVRQPFLLAHNALRRRSTLTDEDEGDKGETGNLAEDDSVFRCRFQFLFRYEGVYKVGPSCILPSVAPGEAEKSLDASSINSDDTFYIPVLSFNVVTKSQ